MNTTFYLTDALGSVLLSFSQNAVLGEQVYGPYGNQLGAEIVKDKPCTLPRIEWLRLYALGGCRLNDRPQGLGAECQAGQEIVVPHAHFHQRCRHYLQPENNHRLPKKWDI